MCGRYATTRSPLDLSAIFEALDETGGALVPDYNVAPTDPVPIVRAGSAGSAGRLLSVARWGLVPGWARDSRPTGKMINARAETVATNNGYARAFRQRRCLVPADGWYEWRRRPDGRGKQAYFMTPRDGSALVFAGIWSGPGPTALSCAVLTTAALGELAEVHDRMPLLLPRRRWASWLGADPAEPDEALLAPPEPAELSALEIRPVGPAVGDVRHDGPGLINRIDIDRVDRTPAGNTDVDPTGLTLF